MFRISGPEPRPLLSRRQTMPARQARRPATSGVSPPQAATHLDRIPPPHTWHRPANLSQILKHSPAVGLTTFCQFISGTFGNVAAGTHFSSDRLDAPFPRTSGRPTTPLPTNPPPS